MIISTLIFLTCLIFTGTTAAPRIHLEHFGNRMFGLPSREAGIRVQNWRRGDKVHPEELGGYLEGDILFGGRLKNGWAWESYRWPGGIIPYTISQSGFNEGDRAMIQSAIDDIHNQTCVRFVPRKNQRVYIRITAKVAGCYSSIGHNGASYDMNLQPGGCTSVKRTVLHELMHVIGFLHEHSRTERDKYVTVYLDNVKDDEKKNFDKYPRGWMNYYNTSYDYKSVMHYSRYAFSKNGNETIVPTDPTVVIKDSDGLSPNDILKINKMYKCNKYANIISGKTRKPAIITTMKKPEDVTTKKPEIITTARKPEVITTKKPKIITTTRKLGRNKTNRKRMNRNKLSHPMYIRHMTCYLYYCTVQILPYYPRRNV